MNVPRENSTRWRAPHFPHLCLLKSETAMCLSVTSMPLQNLWTRGMKKGNPRPVRSCTLTFVSNRRSALFERLTGSQRHSVDAKARLLFPGELDIGTTLKGKNTKHLTDKGDKPENTFVETVPFTPVDDVYGLVTELRTALGCPPEKGNA